MADRRRRCNRDRRRGDSTGENKWKLKLINMLLILVIIHHLPETQHGQTVRNTPKKYKKDIDFLMQIFEKYFN